MASLAGAVLTDSDLQLYQNSCGPHRVLLLWSLYSFCYCSSMCFAIQDVSLKSLAGPGTAYLSVLVYHMLSVYMAGDKPQHSWARLLTTEGLQCDSANAMHPLAALLTLTWLQLVHIQSGSVMGLSLLNVAW